MDYEKIQKIIKHGEGESVEFKTSFNDKVIVALNAFANSKGGSLFLCKVGILEEFLNPIIACHWGKYPICISKHSI